MTRPAEKTPREAAEELAKGETWPPSVLADAIERALREYAAARLREAQRSISGPGYLGGYTGPEQAKEMGAFRHGLATAAECIQRLAAREDGHDAALTPPTPKETDMDRCVACGHEREHHVPACRIGSPDDCHCAMFQEPTPKETE